MLNRICGSPQSMLLPAIFSIRFIFVCIEFPVIKSHFTSTLSGGKGGRHEICKNIVIVLLFMAKILGHCSHLSDFKSICMQDNCIITEKQYKMFSLSFRCKTFKFLFPCILWQRIVYSLFVTLSIINMP